MSARYVEQGGLATAPGPLTCAGTTMYGFWAQAHGDSVRALCDAMFAAPSRDRVVVRPLSSKVLITFVRIDRIVSEPFEHVGELSEREVVIWVPTMLSRPPRALPGPLRRWWPLPSRLLSAMVPCMWLDNPISVASGREVYGYPKSWGCMGSDPEDALSVDSDRPRTDALPAAPEALTLEAFGIERYRSGGAGESVEPRCRPLIEVRKAGGIDGAERDGFGDLLRECGGSLAPGRESAVGSLVDELLSRAELNQLFLKQFRSAAGGGRASSQEIVRAPATDIERFRWRWLPEYELTTHRLDSHPLTERFDPAQPGALRLGLDSQRIDTAFVARFDFRVELGETLWTARRGK